MDHCTYCQSAHTVAGKAAGLSKEQTVAIRENRVDFDPELGALLAVAREAAGNVGEVDDRTWQAAVDAGWTDTELTELSVHISLNLFTNYLQPPGRDRAGSPGGARPVTRSPAWRRTRSP